MKKAPLPGIWRDIVSLKERGANDQAAADALGIRKETLQIKLVNMRKLGFDFPPPGQPGKVKIPADVDQTNAAPPMPIASPKAAPAPRILQPAIQKKAPRNTEAIQEQAAVDLMAYITAFEKRLQTLEQGPAIQTQYRGKQATISKLLAPLGETTAPATFRLGESLLARLRAFSDREGLSQARLVQEGLERLLDALEGKE